MIPALLKLRALPWRWIGGAAVVLLAWWQVRAYADRVADAREAEVRGEWAEAVRIATEQAKQQEADDASAVEDQNDSDSAKVAALEKQVADLLARPPRIVGVRDQPPSSERVPSGQADAGTGGPACPAAVDGGPDDRPVERTALIEYAAVAEKLRLAVLSCQAQWPK